MNDMNIEEVSKLSVSELNQHLAEGAKFIQFSYVISLVVVTFKRYSKVYYIRKGDSAMADGWPYSLLSLLLGWWGIPFGPIYTIWALVENINGKDVTDKVIAALNKSSVNN